MSISNPRALGAVFTSDGVSFRVWAPFAERVAVVGDLNDWDPNYLAPSPEGIWSGTAQAEPGQRYQFELTYQGRTFRKNDPYARIIDRDSKLGVLERSTFEWKHEPVALDRRTTVIYEIHVGTFARSDPQRPGTFAEIERRLPYLAALGVGAIELMPVSAFPTELSWGYNTTNPFAVEGSYGGPDGLRALVDAAHGLGIGVIIDVTYNHLGPAELDLWQFDGWQDNDLGGIYFYNDPRAWTPWGENRPDYGRAEVRAYLRDNALMWFEELKVDGLRLDGTKYVRDVRGMDDGTDTALPDGWSLMQWLNDEIHHHFPAALTLAEDMADNAAVTRGTGEGGLGFDAQWDVGFVHRLRTAVQEPSDDARHLGTVAAAIAGVSGEHATQRVVYSESHDEVANGRARVPTDITPDDPAGFFARRRSMLAATIVFTTPALPMLFEGQEILEDGWFRDDTPVDWSKLGQFPEVHRFYRRLVRVRQDRQRARGLSGPNVHIVRVDEEDKVLVYHRWDEGGPGDDVVVVASFAVDAKVRRVGVPRAGPWRVRVDSTREEVEALVVTTDPADGFDQSVEVALASYAALVLTLDAD